MQHNFQFWWGCWLWDQGWQGHHQLSPPSWWPPCHRAGHHCGTPLSDTDQGTCRTRQQAIHSPPVECMPPLYLVKTIPGPTSQVSTIVHHGMLVTSPHTDKKFIPKNPKLQARHTNHSCFQLFPKCRLILPRILFLQALHPVCYNVTNVSLRPNVLYYSFVSLPTPPPTSSETLRCEALLWSPAELGKERTFSKMSNWYLDRQKHILHRDLSCSTK